MSLESKIEAILFVKAQPVSISSLSKMLGVGNTAVKESLRQLEEIYKERGISILFKDNEVSLGSAPEHGELLERIIKVELTEELSKSVLETLTIVLYHGPVSKADIDFIRGVNSQFILRNLLVRGLIERIVDPKNKRAFLYRPTFDLMQHLGVSRVSELPEYDAVQEEVRAFKETFGSAHNYKNYEHNND